MAAAMICPICRRPAKVERFDDRHGRCINPSVHTDTETGEPVEGICGAGLMTPRGVDWDTALGQEPPL